MGSDTTHNMSVENQVLSSSFVTWCTKCVAQFGNVTLFDDRAHSAASDAARHVASGGDTTWIILSVVSILIGLIFTFVGYEAFYLTLGLIAFLAGSTFVFGLFCGMTNSWIAAVIVGVIAGILLAYVLHKFEKLAIALCGAVGGLVSYMYLNAFLLNKLYNAIPEAHQ